MNPPYPPRKPHEPSRMRLHGPVSVDDVLQALVGRTARIPSNTLSVEPRSDEPRKAVNAEREIGGVSNIKPKHTTDPWRAMDEAEQAIGREVGVLRCMADLARVRAMRGPKSFFVCKGERSAGELLLMCLRAYHEWASQSQERGLAEVSAWLGRLEGLNVDGAALAQDFREGKAKRARARASSTYREALLMLSSFVQKWNAKSL